MRFFSARLSFSLVLWIGGLALAWMPLENDPAPLPGTPASTSPAPRLVPALLRPGPGEPRKLEKQTVHVYSFHLRTGELLLLSFDQSVDILVEVTDPEEKIFKVDSPRSTRISEAVPLLADRDGLYEVRVSSKNEGFYTPRIVERRAARARDRTLLAAVRALSRAEDLRRAASRDPRMDADYAEAARLAGVAGAKVLQADAYLRLGLHQCDIFEWKGCRDALRSALVLLKKQGDLDEQAVALGALGKAFKNLDQLDAASSAFTTAIDLSRKTGRVKTEANAWIDLGLMQIDAGEYEPALRSFERARELFRKSNSPISEVSAMNGSGRAYVALGRFEDAFALHKEALERLKAAKTLDEDLQAQTLLHLGDAYRGFENFNLAIPCYLSAIKIFKRLGNLALEASAQNNLGLAYYHADKYPDALDVYLAAARTFHDQRRFADEAIALSNVGWLQIDMDHAPQALTAFEGALAAGQRLHRRPVEMAAYFGIAWAERHRKNPIAARVNIQKAVSILEDLRRDAQKPGLRSSLLSARMNFYDFLLEILMEQHRLQPADKHDVEAFAASEGTRARSLLESLGTRSSPPLVSMSDVRSQLLDDDTVLLEYFLGDDKSFLWAVTRGSYVTFELPARSRIEPLAREVYELLKRSHHTEDLPAAARKARELAEILLGPVANRLGNKRLLIVVPPSLQTIPFAALPDITERAPEDPPTSWPTPLIVRHEIVSAPSASVVAMLRKIRASRTPPRDLLALITDPVYLRTDHRLDKVRNTPGFETFGADLLAGRFPPLEYLDDEARAISRIAGGQNVLDLHDFAANRDRILDGILSTYRYIHFAVHGEPDRTNPEFSSVVLSAFDEQGRTHDPFLYARDIQDLKLSADLVVIASCGSGLGQELRGEGLVGLTQAFLTAGASRVLVSLWSLNDPATSDLMQSFYLNLLKRGKSPAAALREAQVQIWRKGRWNAPSYWGGFVLQGEWK